jgi:CRP/FNR family transcriptional regulator, anaerobic regulatory protein
MDKLLNFLDSLYPLPTELREELLKILKWRIFERKEFLLKAGHISRSIYYIEKGLVRCYYSIKEKDISAWFMKEGDIVVSVNSFFGQTASSESIQALEDTTVHFITHTELEELYNRFLSFNVHGRKVVTHYYLLSEQRAISMRSIKAKERYGKLLFQNPELLQRVPGKYLASYLGITEATFSNINRKTLYKTKPPI